MILFWDYSKENRRLLWTMLTKVVKDEQKIVSPLFMEIQYTKETWKDLSFEYIHDV